ncbi:hypothetical protein BDK51DRAFT_49491 [Blyttiomyces helicus]|uniref:Uncharacterized protein n=1 Tax=Blyttiomyces helicus TaxID=388810 RepID=A0A4P9WKL5_9FUNG|nr:hypothetical protein BDK51DRAFT_49491 [Blyttiomyces helicus]|eukprot:RKO92118.1 hypothetical protein BDK51DRAFT_49491 [Blyttiomyces helicus]
MNYHYLRRQGSKGRSTVVPAPRTAEKLAGANGPNSCLKPQMRPRSGLATAEASSSAVLIRVHGTSNHIDGEWRCPTPFPLDPSNLLRVFASPNFQTPQAPPSSHTMSQTFSASAYCTPSPVSPTSAEPEAFHKRMEMMAERIEHGENVFDEAASVQDEVVLEQDPAKSGGSGKIRKFLVKVFGERRFHRQAR